MNSHIKGVIFRSSIAAVLIFLALLFTISAVRNVNINREKDVVMMDALGIEFAAREYCESNQCFEGLELTWNEIKEFAEGVEIENYNVTEDQFGDKVVAYYLYGFWIVELLAKEEGMYEWHFSQVSTLRNNQTRRNHIVKKES